MDLRRSFYTGCFWLFALALSGCRAEPAKVEPVAKAEPVKVPLFQPAGFTLDARCETLIISAEVSGGEREYTRGYSRPIWPGGASGITWGIGWDGGYNNEDTILRVWVKLDGVKRLVKVAGLTGPRAKAELGSVRDIVVPWFLAKEVFNADTVPRFYQQMTRAWPRVVDLDPAAQGALLSVVFNRGPGMVGDSRVDMRTIAALVPKKDYHGIGAAVRHMNVTMAGPWKRAGIYNGLSKRREAEAAIIEACR